MKKQRKRIYTALLCTCFLFSTASVPVSAAETEQGEMITLSNRSGEAEVSMKDALTSALGDSTKDTVKLTADIIIDTTLTVNRAVTLDLNGNVLKMNGSGSVIKVESGGNLTIQDSNTSTPHKFTPGGDGLWGLDETGGSEIVYGGIITGGNTPNGGGVYVATGCQLTMTGGNIVGCLVYVGTGARSVDWMGEVLEAKSRQAAAPTFYPTGLYLTGVGYPEIFGLPQHGASPFPG